MPERRRSSDLYREEARALRELADKAVYGPHRDKLLEIATQYERLADSIDRAERRHPDDPQAD